MRAGAFSSRRFSSVPKRLNGHASALRNLSDAVVSRSLHQPSFTDSIAPSRRFTAAMTSPRQHAPRGFRMSQAQR